MFLILVLPHPSYAATSKPTCTLSVTTDAVTIRIRSNDTLYIRSGMSVGITWSSRNATKVSDDHRKSVAGEGSATTTLTRDKKLTYTFSRGSARTTCSVSFKVVSGSIVQKTVRNSVSAFEFSGKMRGSTKAIITVAPLGTTTPIYTSTTNNVRNGSWSHTVKTALQDGNYTVSLFAVQGTVSTLVATTTLQVGTSTQVAVGASTIVVLPVPLLIGGIGHSGATVAVAYLQVINIGKVPAQLRAISLTQFGTAPTAAIVGMTAITDNGVARGSVGTMLTGTPFLGNTVTVPIVVVLAPGEMRLVTIKAVLAPNLSANTASTISLYVTGVTSDANLSAKFPLYGTTWTISS